MAGMTRACGRAEAAILNDNIQLGSHKYQDTTLRIWGTKTYIWGTTSIKTLPHAFGVPQHTFEVPQVSRHYLTHLGYHNIHLGSPNYQDTTSRICTSRHCDTCGQSSTSWQTPIDGCLAICAADRVNPTSCATCHTLLLQHQAVWKQRAQCLCRASCQGGDAQTSTRHLTDGSVQPCFGAVEALAGPLPCTAMTGV